MTSVIRQIQLVDGFNTCVLTTAVDSAISRGRTGGAICNLHSHMTIDTRNLSFLSFRATKWSDTAISAEIEHEVEPLGSRR